ncbi:MAG TPA: hypothetical protein P5076_13635 [Myxococcota bacterium]|nr:hypothetical protein [Myxococcota bacterium]
MMWAMVVRLVCAGASHIVSSLISLLPLFGEDHRNAFVVYLGLRWLGNLAMVAALVGLLLATSMREVRRAFASAAAVGGFLALAEITFTSLMAGSLLGFDFAKEWARTLFPVAVHLEPCLDIAFLTALLWALGARAGFRRLCWRWTAGLTAVYLVGLILRVWMPITQPWFKEHVWWRAGLAIATMALSGAALLWLLHRLSRPTSTHPGQPSGA